MVPDDALAQRASEAAVEAYERVINGEDDEAVQNPGLRARLARVIAGKEWPTEPAEPEKTTTAGSLSTDFAEWRAAFFIVETERIDIYETLEEMESTMEEVHTALDVLADEAVNPESGAHAPFRMDFEVGYTPPKVVRRLMDETLDRVQLEEKAFGIARDLLLYGDNFLQVVIDEGFHVNRLMYMPPKSMIRNEDRLGLLKTGKEEGEWAFEQIEPRTDHVIAGFYPWQIEHLRWNRRGSSKYGRGLYYSARASYRKLRAMEEAVSINWLTRAFARLLFTIDTTGMSPDEAEKAIRNFQFKLKMRQVGSESLAEQKMTVPKDIYMGLGYHQIGGRMYEDRAGVQVLDSSNTGFWNLNPVEYYRDKVVVVGRVPKAYLGLGQDVRTKQTLAQQDRRFARTVRRIQQLLSYLAIRIVDLELLLQGINPLGIPYKPMWPSTAMFDELDRSQALLNFGRASVLFRRLQALDAEYAARSFLHMTPAEWDEMVKRLEQQLKDQLELLDTHGVLGDMLQVASSGFGARQAGGMQTEPPEGQSTEPVKDELSKGKPNA